MSRRVVITGTGVLSPIGNSTSEFFEGLKKGLKGLFIAIHLSDSKMVLYNPRWPRDEGHQGL